MATFSTAYLIVWLTMTLYIIRLGMRQRRIVNALPGQAAHVTCPVIQPSPTRQQDCVRCG